MRVVLASDYGFCFGVKSAVETLERELENGEIHTDGDVIHNSRVMRRLLSSGLKIFKSPPGGKTFAVRAHGLPPAKVESFRKIYERILDLTCPIVRSLFAKALECYKSGYKVVVFGKRGHAEMEALLGHVPEAIVTLEAGELKSEKICVLSQTTSSWIEFSEFVERLVNLNFQMKEIKILNTVCPVTFQREKETEELAKRCDVVVVVGGKHSANTGKLYRIASRYTKALWIESPDEIDDMGFDDVECVAIVSGTSTPAEDVERVYEKISRRG